MEKYYKNNYNLLLAKTALARLFTNGEYRKMTPKAQAIIIEVKNALLEIELKKPNN